MSAERVRFGTFELDLASGELRSRGQRVPLQDQPAQLLALLVRRQGEVVTREELRRALWSDDTFVAFDTALNVAVNKVRQALRDSATSPRFVETLPKRGYRFLADVQAVEPPPAVATEEAVAGAPVPSRRTAWMVASAVVALLAVLAFTLPDRLCRPGAPASPRSVAVLPFKPLIAESRDEALEMGMAEAVIVKLGQQPALRVPSLGAVRRYAGLGPNPLQAGRELGVDTVLDGSLQRSNGRLRVSARLLDVRTETSRWARQWDLPWTDVFTVQDALATEVARELALSLAPAQGRHSAKQATNPEAYERYLRARYLVTQRTPDDSRRAVEILDEVIALDPDFAPAHAVQADAYMALPWLGEPREPSITRARQAALRSLELDPTGAAAHATLGTILAQFDWDPQAGERELERAFELDPDDPTVLRFYSVLLWHEGRFDEALAMNERELLLDPASVFANRNRAIILYYARRYDESVAQSLKTLELDRYFHTAYHWLGRSYEQLGREREAAEAYIAPLTFSETNQKEAATLRAAAGSGGLRAFWKRWLTSEPARSYASSDLEALAWLKVGDRERALATLERLCDQRSPWLRAIKVEPQWDPLRGDPRFEALLRKANLVRSPP
jgi:DNA-binding winged helix-turn-helix (wHTH) protein/TolB-like protein